MDFSTSSCALPPSLTYPSGQFFSERENEEPLIGFEGISSRGDRGEENSLATRPRSPHDYKYPRAPHLLRGGKTWGFINCNPPCARLCVCDRGWSYIEQRQRIKPPSKSSITLPVRADVQDGGSKEFPSSPRLSSGSPELPWSRFFTRSKPEQ